MIQLSKHSGIYTLEVSQELPIDLAEAWEFFSTPANLQKITPEYMRFKITSKLPERVYEGLIISYKVTAIPGLRMSWVTEITHIKEPNYFVDEQRFGPYAMWHHEHHFEATETGVCMTDKLAYKLPLGWLGHLVEFVYLRRQLRSIFAYRKRKLEQLFLD